MTGSRMGLVGSIGVGDTRGSGSTSCSPGIAIRGPRVYLRCRVADDHRRRDALFVEHDIGGKVDVGRLRADDSGPRFCSHKGVPLLRRVYNQLRHRPPTPWENPSLRRFRGGGGGGRGMELVSGDRPRSQSRDPASTAGFPPGSGPSHPVRVHTPDAARSRTRARCQPGPSVRTASRVVTYRFAVTSWHSRRYGAGSVPMANPDAASVVPFKVTSTSRRRKARPEPRRALCSWGSLQMPQSISKAGTWIRAFPRRSA